MNQRPGPMEIIRRSARAIGRGLFRAALALFGLALMLAALIAGAMLAVVLTAWALLRGRRQPPARFAWRGFPPAGRPGHVPPRTPGGGEVVDIEAREIPSGER